MKKILLLGGFGFIGTNILKFIDSHLINMFSAVVFDRTQEHPKGVRFNCIEKTYQGDFCDKIALRSIFEDHKFDYVIHAITTTVPSTSINARFDVESNLLPTIDLLELLVEYETQNIIFISSGGAIYGDMLNNVPHKETDFENPKSSYGIVKLAIEKYLFQYKELFGIRPLVLRVSNPYGPYHYSLKQGIVNISLNCAKNNIPFSVWGDGESKKDYIYIDDLCYIIFELIHLEINDEIFNIASNEILSINEILIKIKSHFQNFVWTNSKTRNNDVLNFQLDTSKLLQTIEKVNFTTFDEGIVKTMNWLIATD
jgi:UDP-glucose 4-epimerase